MCGRFHLKKPGEALRQLFGLGPERPPEEPRYNIAPTQPILAVREAGGGPEIFRPHWGLVPHWSKAPAGRARMINARGETAAEKAAFRGPFRNRRCLIPADGFYEWHGRGPDSHPFALSLAGDRPFAFAALWDRWQGPEGRILETAAILTTTPNAILKPIHERMPVILPPAHFSIWLDPAQHDPQRLQPLLVPFPAELMRASPVGKFVNDPRHEGPQCLV